MVELDKEEDYIGNSMFRSQFDSHLHPLEYLYKYILMVELDKAEDYK
jgi:hypothetical protein